MVLWILGGGVQSQALNFARNFHGLFGKGFRRRLIGSVFVERFLDLFAADQAFPLPQAGRAVHRLLKHLPIAPCMGPHASVFPKHLVAAGAGVNQHFLLQTGAGSFYLPRCEYMTLGRCFFPVFIFAAGAGILVPPSLFTARFFDVGQLIIVPHGGNFLRTRSAAAGAGIQLPSVRFTFRFLRFGQLFVVAHRGKLFLPRFPAAGAGEHNRSAGFAAG